jgi:sporulation protein YlmC with PRC-barrel domain
MNFKVLMTASVLAFMAASPAMAGDTKAGASTTTTTTTTVGQDVKDTISDVANKVGEAGENVYQEIKYTFFGNDTMDQGVVVTVNRHATANGIIGEPVLNTRGERVGTMRDIILDANGKAVVAVVSDAEVIDIAAKTTAFDYALIMRQDQNGDIIMPLEEETIENARSFSYDLDDAGKADVVTPPASGYSVRELLDADVENERGDDVAEVENIVFRNGKADTLIVTFDKVLGMGGKTAALAFADVRAVREDDSDDDDFSDDVDFQLSAAQSTRFEAFKNGASN